MQIHARKRKIRAALGILLAILGIASIATQVQARPAKPAKPPQSAPVEKDSIVLMPLRLSGADKVMKASMEAALVNGLQQKYTVISGEAVEKGVKEIFTKESAKKDCNADLCYVEISVKFKVGLIAIAEVNKIEGGYLLALSIKDVVTNEVKSQPSSCENCNSFQVIEKLKELSAMMAPAPAQTTQAVVAAPVEVPQPKINQNDPDAVLWAEVQKGNTADDYQVYLDTYPKGKYTPLAKARIKKQKEQELAETRKLQEEATAEQTQKDSSAWESAKTSATENSYQQYLSNYPNGNYVNLAKARIAKLQKDLADQEAHDDKKAWEDAVATATKSGYEEYIGIYPQGKYVAQARASISKLDQAEKRAAQEQERKFNEEVAAEVAKQARLDREAAAQLAQQDRNAWDSANGASTEASYQNYLNRYPQGSYAALAQTRITTLRKAALAANERRQREAQVTSTPAATTYSSYPTSYGDMPQIAKRNNCTACHAIGKRVVGPAWADVAQKYKGDPNAEAKLILKVSNGGGGVWGSMRMPSMDAAGTKQADIKELVQFILGLAK
jgi:cytochrome c